MMRSKNKIICDILKVVFTKFCDDEDVALLIQEYYKAEKRLQEKKQSSQKIEKHYFRVTQEVRDWLEPLVDAEYYKNANYKSSADSYLIYQAMHELKTKVDKKLTEKMKKELKHE